MEHDSWAPSFWRSLVALPLPLQSYCQGNSERAARHLVHYHTALVSGSGEVWYLLSWKYFLSLWQRLFAFCSLRYTNSFSRVKLFSRDCLQLITAVIESGSLLLILMNWGLMGIFFLFTTVKPNIVLWRMSASVCCSCLDERPYYFNQNKWLSLSAAIIWKAWRPPATGWWFINLHLFDRFSLLTLLPPSDTRQLHCWLIQATGFYIGNVMQGSK